MAKNLTIQELFKAEAPGLTPLAVAVFMIVAGKGKISPKSLGKELQVPQANILRALAGLESDQGLVIVEESGPLKKIARVSDRGLSLAEKIKDLVAN